MKIVKTERPSQHQENEINSTGMINVADGISSNYTVKKNTFLIFWNSQLL